MQKNNKQHRYRPPLGAAAAENPMLGILGDDPEYLKNYFNSITLR